MALPTYISFTTDSTWPRYSFPPPPPHPQKIVLIQRYLVERITHSDQILSFHQHIDPNPDNVEVCLWHVSRVLNPQNGNYRFVLRHVAMFSESSNLGRTTSHKSDKFTFRRFWILRCTSSSCIERKFCVLTECPQHFYWLASSYWSPSFSSYLGFLLNQIQAATDIEICAV